MTKAVCPHMQLFLARNQSITLSGLIVNTCRYVVIYTMSIALTTKSLCVHVCFGVPFVSKLINSRCLPKRSMFTKEVDV